MVLTIIMVDYSVFLLSLLHLLSTIRIFHEFSVSDERDSIKTCRFSRERIQWIRGNLLIVDDSFITKDKRVRERREVDEWKIFIVSVLVEKDGWFQIIPLRFYIKYIRTHNKVMRANNRNRTIMIIIFYIIIFLIKYCDNLFVKRN